MNEVKKKKKGNFRITAKRPMCVSWKSHTNGERKGRVYLKKELLETSQISERK